MATEKPPPPPPPSKLQERLAAEQAALEARANPPAAPPPAEWAGRKNLFGEPYQGGLFGRGGTLGLGLGADPWQTTMERTVTPAIPQPLQGASKYVLPQNSVDLAVQGLTLGSPLGGLAGKGALAGMKGVGGVGTRMAVKALEGGLGGGIAGKLTGHDTSASAMQGGIGGAAGQGVGEGLGALAQSSTVTKMVEKAPEQIQGALKSMFGALVPTEPPTATVKRIINGDIVAEVQKDIGTMLGRKYHGNAPAGFETDGVVTQLAKDAANQGLDIWKSKGVPSLGKMWALLPEARQELSRFLSPKDQVAFGLESQKLRAAELAQNVFTGGRTPAEATKALFDKGKLTEQGIAELQTRFGALTQADLAMLGPGAKELGTALFQDAGTAVAQVGTPGALPKVSVGVIPKVHVSAAGGAVPWQPGWEQAAGPVAQLFKPGAGGAKAAEAVAAQTAPRGVGAEAPPARTPPPAPVEPTTAPVMPPLTPPPPTRPVPPAAFTAVPPPPVQPSPPAGWFNPEAAPAAAEPAPMPPLTPRLPAPQELR